MHCQLPVNAMSSLTWLAPIATRSTELPLQWNHTCFGRQPAMLDLQARVVQYNEFVLIKHGMR